MDTFGTPWHARVRAYLLLVLVVSVWGSYPALNKVAIREMAPLTLVALRCTLASLLLVLLAIRERPLTLPSPRDFRMFLLLGISGITISTGISYPAVALTTASNVVLLTVTTTILVVLGAHLFQGERLRPIQWTGIWCSTAGVLLILSHGELRRLVPSALQTGDLLILVGQGTWAIYTLYGQRVLRHYSPVVATTYAYLVGTLPLIPLSVALAPAFPPTRWTAWFPWALIAYQGALGTLSHIWWYRGVQAVGPSETAIFMYLQPVVGLLLAVTVVGERVGPLQILGGAAVLAGMWLTTHSPTRRSPGDS